MALDGDATEVVFGVVVAVVEDGDAEFTTGEIVGLVVAGVEIEVDVAELTQFGLGVVLGYGGAFEHEGVDEAAIHDLDDFLLHLELVAVP